MFMLVCADSARKKILSMTKGSALHHHSNIIREDSQSSFLCPIADKIYISAEIIQMKTLFE